MTAEAETATGVTWAASRSGKIQIALGTDRDSISARGQIDVWAIYTGTHDAAPVSRRFTGPTREADAREYANTLWRTR